MTPKFSLYKCWQHCLPLLKDGQKSRKQTLQPINCDRKKPRIPSYLQQCYKNEVLNFFTKPYINVIIDGKLKIWQFVRNFVFKFEEHTKNNFQSLNTETLKNMVGIFVIFRKFLNYLRILYSHGFPLIETHYQPVCHHFCNTKVI